MHSIPGKRPWKAFEQCPTRKRAPLYLTLRVYKAAGSSLSQCPLTKHNRHFLLTNKVRRTSVVGLQSEP